MSDKGTCRGAPKRVRAGTQDTGLPWIGQRGRVCLEALPVALAAHMEPLIPLTDVMARWAYTEAVGTHSKHLL